MIILIGVPGSGKSTQGQMLIDRGKLRWLSMGKVLRGKIKGARSEQMLAGKLLDSQLVIKILSEELKILGDEPELILDGFPRHIDQASWLLGQKDAGNLKVSALINLYAKESIVEKRLMARGRLDDTPMTIANRFDIYRKTFKPVIKMIRDDGIPIIEIDADQTPTNISNDIVKGLLKVGIEA